MKVIPRIADLLIQGAIDDSRGYQENFVNKGQRERIGVFDQVVGMTILGLIIVHTRVADVDNDSEIEFSQFSCQCKDL